MAKSRKPRGDSGVWVLTECNMEEGDALILGVFLDECSAIETRDYCQMQFVDEPECDAYYSVVCLPIRQQRMSLDAILRRTGFVDVFEKNKKEKT